MKEKKNCGGNVRSNMKNVVVKKSPVFFLKNNFLIGIE
jgi:hypothetical protein